MKKTIASTTLAAAFGAAVGIASTHVAQPPKPVVIPEHIPAACRAVVEEMSPGLLNSNPQLGRVQTIMGDETKPRTVWTIGGAVMPEKVQQCLDSQP